MFPEETVLNLSKVFERFNFSKSYNPPACLVTKQLTFSQVHFKNFKSSYLPEDLLIILSNIS